MCFGWYVISSGQLFKATHTRAHYSSTSVDNEIWVWILLTCGYVKNTVSVIQMGVKMCLIIFHVMEHAPTFLGTELLCTSNMKILQSKALSLGKWKTLSKTAELVIWLISPFTADILTNISLSNGLIYSFSGYIPVKYFSSRVTTMDSCMLSFQLVTP